MSGEAIVTQITKDKACARHWVIPAVLVSCTGVNILSTDLYAPSLPHLPRLLGTSPEMVQLTISLNLAAYASAQLVHGPLADRFGRRALLLVGLFGFLIASLGCAVAPSIDGLLIGRIAQGIFSSVPGVVVVLVVRELYKDERAVRIMGLYGMALGVVPAIGPLIGGYIYLFAGWRMNFLVLAALGGFVMLLVMRYLPETGVPDGAALRPRRIAAAYLRLLRLRAYLRYLIPLAGLFGSFFAFVTAGPFVLIDQLGVATQHYGLAYGLLVLAFIAGGLAVNRLAGRLTADRLVRDSVIIALVGGFALLLPVLAGHESLVGILFGMTILTFGIGLILASGPICLLDAAGDGPRGSASALVSALQMAAASLAGLLVGSFHNGTALPMAAVIASFVSVAALGYFALGVPMPARRADRRS